MASSESAKPAKRKPCILLAEDDQDDFYFFQLAMEKCAGEINLIHAVDGDAAMAYLEDTSTPNPDLIVTDLKMPKINGFELLEWLKQHPELSKLPTVVFSSSDEVTDRKRARELGAKSYHVKPGDHRGFVEEVNQICTQLLTGLKP
jgi:two-component system, chemotaxis family, response regulator Rcp1